MLNLNSKSNGMDSDSSDRNLKNENRGGKQSRDVPENTKRLPMGPPDNVTKGFSIKRTTEHKSLPKLDAYEAVTISDTKPFDMQAFFSGIKGLQSMNSTPEGVLKPSSNPSSSSPPSQSISQQP